jgi:hypothetical protein
MRSMQGSRLSHDAESPMCQLNGAGAWYVLFAGRISNFGICLSTAQALNP